MKKIEALIRPNRFDEVKAALLHLGVSGLTVSHVRCDVLGTSPRLAYRCQEYAVDLEPKVKIEVVVGSRSADDVVEAIVDVARTGNIDDGQIFISEIAEAIRICNRQRDEAAV